MEQIQYKLIYFFVKLLAKLPLRVLYLLSDLLYLIVYYVVGYRRAVVRENLRNSFPEKAMSELMVIEKKFYHHFCDYMVESLKQVQLTESELLSRCDITNLDFITEWSKKKRSAILMLGHYGNWEWFTSLNFRVSPVLFCQVYRELKNSNMDRLFLQIRSVYKSINIEKAKTMRVMTQFKRENKQVLVALLADQTPSVKNLHYWTTFLNQETAVLTGGERIAQKVDYDVFYLDIQKVGRGKYVGEFKLISDNPKESGEFEITERYARLMEETIMREPAYWLWTHRRWKHKRPVDQ